MIDLIELEKALKEMKPRHKLYAIVKAEMVARGRWKAKPRGVPMQKGQDDRRNTTL